jgi:hypothetical protein
MSFEPRPYLFDDKVPYSYYTELYEHLSSTKPVLIIVSTADNAFKVYFSTSDTQPNHMHSYVFFRKADAVAYLKYLRDRSPTAEIMAMEMSVGVLANSYKKVFAKVRAMDSTKTYCAYSAIYHNEEFKEMEVFWSDSNKNIC